MAKTQTKEVAVIDFEKFSVAQLPELQGKKEEIKGIIEANPVVEIIDNASYELAKKSRTAVKTLCTGLEGEQKTVKKRIKEFVLDAVDKEYDTLVLGARSALKERQEPITAWEDKKEQERLEKARLEQERIDGIKTKISVFFMDWSAKIGSLQFANLENLELEFKKSIEDYNRNELQEFEVLFDDSLSNLTYMFSEKKANLVAQEQIRIDNLLIQEKNAENSRIQEWQRTWNANIDTLSFDDVKDVKSVLVKSKLANLKHYSAEYNEIYISTEKRLNSQIELISKAETQRIAQEKFQKEKAEFEAKQLEAKFQERKKFLVDEDYWRIYLLAECAEEEDVAKSKLLNYSDEAFEDFKLAVLKAKEPKEDVKTDEIAQEQIERVYDSEPIASNIQNVVGNRIIQANYHESDVDPKGIEKEVTWESIWEEWIDRGSKEDFLDYLREFYNAPTKKQ